MGQAFSDNHAYDDIMGVTYRKSTRRAWMPQVDRAAQFSPFAALTGLDDTMDETARITEERIELDEEAKARLDGKLRQILAEGDESSRVRVTYFKPDGRKMGGAYVTAEEKICKVDAFRRVLRLTGDLEIPLDDIVEIDRIEHT